MACTIVYAKQINQLFSAPKIPLNERCDQRDICRDNFAECNPFEAKCLCIEGYFERNRQCGMFVIHVSLISFTCFTNIKTILKYWMCKKVENLNWIWSLYYLVPKIPLYEQCRPGDECEDSNAGCIGGKCLCVPDFFERDLICCESNDDRIHDFNDLEIGIEIFAWDRDRDTGNLTIDCIWQSWKQAI